MKMDQLSKFQKLSKAAKKKKKKKKNSSCIKEWKINIQSQKIKSDNSGAFIALRHPLIFWLLILILPSLIQ